jgi:hypothetical protein
MDNALTWIEELLSSAQLADDLRGCVTFALYKSLLKNLSV